MGFVVNIKLLPNDVSDIYTLEIDENKSLQDVAIAFSKVVFQSNRRMTFFLTNSLFDINPDATGLENSLSLQELTLNETPDQVFLFARVEEEDTDVTPRLEAEEEDPIKSQQINCTIFFYPEGWSHTVVMWRGQQIKHMKRDLNENLNIDTKNVRLMHEGIIVEDDAFIEIYGDDPIFTFHMIFDQEFKEDKEVEVEEVPMDHAPFELDLYKKPFLGGYRDKRNGKEYHHAFTQTFKKINMVQKFHRDTQTVHVVDVKQQCPREMSTQTIRRDLCMEGNYRVVESGEYETADVYEAKRNAAAVTIQRVVRGYLARKQYGGLLMDRSKEEEAILEMARKKDEYEAFINEKRRKARLSPRSNRDFKQIHDEVAKWHQREVDRINMMFPDKEDEDQNKERQERMKALLSKETQMLQAIGKLKIKANKENRKNAVTKTLKLMSAPKLWAMSDGSVCEVSTPLCVRAEELKTLYEGLTSNIPLDERLDVLLHVKCTVKEFDCALTRDIVDLIDREADLISRNRPVKTMKGLRQRISNLFLRFIETPEFNPEAARFQRVPVDFRVSKDHVPIVPFSR
ncbi:hypothetical protein PCE1_001855 [Barthelona sp. PCE]